MLGPAIAAGQTLSQRGFVEGAAVVFPQKAPTDSTQAVADLRARDEIFYKPASWVQFAAGVEFRTNSHDQVESSWRVDYGDRGLLRPRLSIRRLSATLTRGRLTVDVGKQFLRWGKTDIVTPTDRFAPRDFLTVIDAEFLAINAARGVVQLGDETFDVVWSPRFTPSRTPLVDQRWTATPVDAPAPIVDLGGEFPSGSQIGVRWSHSGAWSEYALSYFKGFNHLPVIRTVSSSPALAAFARLFPEIRMYGADLAAPTRWFTVKVEAAFFQSASESQQADDYLLYVVQLERQRGEWVFVAGYAGEMLMESRSLATFAPDRGLSRAVVARASYTVDPSRSIAFEGAVRQNGDGVYARAEYSQAHGQHWRTTIAATAIGGRADDFLGQYRRNSHGTATLRYSF
jgi:hypothetical protein